MIQIEQLVLCERLLILSGDPCQLIAHFSGALIPIGWILRERSQHCRFQSKRKIGVDGARR
jgi:hypothetical protein